MAGDSSAWQGLILASLAFAAVVAGSVFLYRRLRFRTAYVLTIAPLVALDGDRGRVGHPSPPGLDVMRMKVISAIRRVPGVVVAMVAIAAVMVVSQPARSYTGAIGYVVNVKATPTVGLADGQAVAVHVETVGGITMFDVQAHLCQAGAGIKNGFEFDLDGPYCSPSRVSPAADAAVDQRGGGSSADLTFHVGVGTGAPWNETDGGTHTLTCGPGAPCDLVLQVAMSEQNFYHAIPLCFGDGCGPESGTAPPPVAGSTGAGTGGAAGSTTGAANGAGTAVGGGGPRVVGGAAADGTAAAGTGAVGATTRNGGAGGATSSDGSSALGVTAGGSGSDAPVAPWRIVLAGVAGLLCGARIVSVISRGRRPRGQQMGFA